VVRGDCPETVDEEGGAMSSHRSWFLAVVMIVLVGSTPGSAAAFGTIDSGGQNREHERITRAALACTGEAGSDAACFEPLTMDLLAGHDREFGAVGSPDKDELSLPAAHCDNVDFLAGEYPRTREQATEAVLDCVNQLRGRFGEGVDSAAELVDAEGRVVAEEVGADPECRFGEAGARREEDSRAKCASLGAFGRVLHGVQDFYAHSNWADAADPTRPLGAENPPGLNLPGPSPVLDLRVDTPPDIPSGLTGGCYALRDQVPGVGECENRVTHAALNKDRGLIDPVTGDTSDPTTPRGAVGDNFAKAVTGAIVESRRQWGDFQSELTDRYGRERAETMICALTHDDPAEDCSERPWSPIIGAVLVACLGIAATTAAVLRTRRRRR
jgi:hypothetical protein